MNYRAGVVSSSIFAVCVLLTQPISAYAQAAGGTGGTSGGTGGTSGGTGGTSGGTGGTSGGTGSSAGGASSAGGSSAGGTSSASGATGSGSGASSASGGTSGASSGTAAGGTSGTSNSTGSGTSTAGGASGTGGRSATASAAAASANATVSRDAPTSGSGNRDLSSREYYVTCSASSCDQLTQVPENAVDTPARTPLTRRSRHHYIRELSPDELAAQDPWGLSVRPVPPRASGYRRSQPSHALRHEFAYGKAPRLRHVAHAEPTPNAGELHDVALPARPATAPKVDALPVSLVDIVPKSELDPSTSAPLAVGGRTLPPAAPQGSTEEPGSAASVSTDRLLDNTPDSSLGTERNPIANFPKPATSEPGPAPVAAPAPSTQSDLLTPLVIAEQDANAIHDCAGRDVTVAASDSKLFLSGICRSVTIQGSKDNVLVEISNAGKLLILGDHNAVIWSSGADGPDPVVVSADESNTVIHLRSKSNASAPLVTMETARLASGPSLNQ
jgi:Protein of unknown function (DUF3060)